MRNYLKSVSNNGLKCVWYTPKDARITCKCKVYICKEVSLGMQGFLEVFAFFGGGGGDRVHWGGALC